MCSGGCQGLLRKGAIGIMKPLSCCMNRLEQVIHCHLVLEDAGVFAWLEAVGGDEGQVDGFTSVCFVLEDGCFFS